MISVCPNCHSHFKVSVSLLGDTGRTVRCSICENTWFQEPVPDEGDFIESGGAQVLADEAEAEHVYQDPNESEGEDISFEQAIEFSNANSSSIFIDRHNHDKGRRVVYGIVFALFVTTFIYGLLNKDRIKQQWPESRVLYAAIGLGDEKLADGVLFDAVDVKVDRHAVHIAGSMINLKANSVKLPYLKADFLDENANVVHSASLPLEKMMLDAEEIYAFKHVLSTPDIIDQAGQVRLGFSITPVSSDTYMHNVKIDAKGGGNIPVPHAGESDR